MSNPGIPTDTQQQPPSGMRLVLTIGLLSIILYGITYLVQRAIFLNGHLNLDINGPGSMLSMPQLRLQIAAYFATNIGLYVLYGWLLVACKRGRIQHPWALRLIWIFPILVSLGYLLGRPYFSIDLFTYIVHSYIGAGLHGNPYLEPARSIGNMPFGFRLGDWGWNPVHGASPYGPLWTWIELGIGRLTLDISLAMLLMKSLMVIASLASAWAIWAILGKVRPRDQLFGTVLYLWNPLVIIEFAGEGHNDALLLACALLALLLAVRGRPMASVVAMIISALAKYITVILLPAQLLFVWRTRRSVAQALIQIGLALIIGGLIAFLLFRPLWAGAETFTGVREQGKVSFYSSTPMLPFKLLQRWYSEDASAIRAGLLMDAIFGIYLLLQTIRVRDHDSLLRMTGNATLAFLLLASPTYWSWYAVTPIAFLALSPSFRTTVMIIVLSFCARAVAPIDDIANNGFGDWNSEVWISTIVGLVIPLLILLGLSLWEWWRGRRQRLPGSANALT